MASVFPHFYLALGGKQNGGIQNGGVFSELVSVNCLVAEYPLMYTE